MVTVLGGLLAADDTLKSPFDTWDLEDDQIMDLLPGAQPIPPDKVADTLLGTVLPYLDSRLAWQQFAQQGLRVFLHHFCHAVPPMVKLVADHCGEWRGSAGSVLTQMFYALGQASISWFCPLYDACS